LEIELSAFDFDVVLFGHLKREPWRIKLVWNCLPLQQGSHVRPAHNRNRFGCSRTLAGLGHYLGNSLISRVLTPALVFGAKIFYLFDFSELTAFILLRVKLVGAMLLNQFIVQTKNQNRGSPLPDKKRLMVSI
jgi:hypothetical protein